MTDQGVPAEPQNDPDMSTPDDTIGAGTVYESRVTVRRAPRYPRFIILGAGLGAVITFIGTAALPVDQTVGYAALFGYFALIGVPIGAALGAILAIVLDAVATRRARQFDAEHTTVDAVPEDVEGDIEN